MREHVNACVCGELIAANGNGGKADAHLTLLVLSALFPLFVVFALFTLFALLTLLAPLAAQSYMLCIPYRALKC